MQNIFIFFPLLFSLFYFFIDFFKKESKQTTKISLLICLWIFIGFFSFHEKTTNHNLLESVTLVTSEYKKQSKTLHELIIETKNKTLFFLLDLKLFSIADKHNYISLKEITQYSYFNNTLHYINEDDDINSTNNNFIYQHIICKTFILYYKNQLSTNQFPHKKNISLEVLETQNLYNINFNNQNLHTNNFNSNNIYNHTEKTLATQTINSCYVQNADFRTEKFIHEDFNSATQLDKNSTYSQFNNKQLPPEVHHELINKPNVNQLSTTQAKKLKIKQSNAQQNISQNKISGIESTSTDKDAKSNDFQFFGNFGFVFDNTNIAFLYVLVLITSLCALLACGYVRYKPSSFLSRLFLLSFALVFFLTAKNLIHALIGFHLISVSLFLLSSIKHNKQEAIKQQSLNGFLFHFFCDFLFLLLIAGLFLTIKEEAYQNIETIKLFTSFLFMLCFCLKCFQFFSLNGLKNTLIAPTIVTALVVFAGISYITLFVKILMFLDMQYLFDLCTFIGICSAIYGFICSCNSKNIKDIIAYSTCAEFGIIFILIGYQLYDALPVYLITYALCKTLFCFCVSAIINSLSGEKDIEKMGGLFLQLPQTYIIFLISILALIGIPFFPVFYSKGFVLMHLLQTTSWHCMIFYLIIFFLNIFSPLKLFFMIFHSETHTDERVLGYINEKNPFIMFTLYLSVFIVLIFSIFFNYTIYNVLLFDLSVQYYIKNIKIWALVLLYFTTLVGVIFIIIKGKINFLHNIYIYKNHLKCAYLNAVEMQNAHSKNLQIQNANFNKSKNELHKISTDKISENLQQTLNFPGNYKDDKFIYNKHLPNKNNELNDNNQLHNNTKLYELHNDTNDFHHNSNLQNDTSSNNCTFEKNGYKQNELNTNFENNGCNTTTSNTNSEHNNQHDCNTHAPKTNQQIICKKLLCKITYNCFKYICCLLQYIDLLLIDMQTKFHRHSYIIVLSLDKFFKRFL